jgi:hypothetical protein
VVKYRADGDGGRIPIMKVTPDGRETTEPYDADLVLVLREVR